MFLVHISPKRIKINQDELVCDWSWILKEWYNSGLWKSKEKNVTRTQEQ